MNIINVFFPYIFAIIKKSFELFYNSEIENKNNFFDFYKLKYF